MWKALEDIYKIRGPILKGVLIAVIYVISNGIGNKIHGNTFSKFYLCNWTIDILNVKLSMWTLSHFIFHFILAYEYNIATMVQLFIGFYWEFIEEYVIDYIPYMKSKCSVGTYIGNYWRA